MKVLLTGAAGFIGMHVAEILLMRGDDVLGLDNLSDYYEPRLKLARIERLRSHSNFKFVECDIADRSAITNLFAGERPQSVINLAAQPGVRYSLKNPFSYIDSNLVGFGNLLECCRNFSVEHFIFASSSSVYGANTKLPYSVHDNVDHPLSLYAASKKANELMAHSYSHLYQLPTTGIRYFTVYGPWGRPDMSPWLFTKALAKGNPINVFNHGNMMRDFTYIDDIAEGTVRIADCIPAGNKLFSSLEPDPGSSHAPYKIYNIGNHQPIKLMDFIGVIEKALGVKANINFLPMQPGDVLATFADISDLELDINFSPKISIGTGVSNFVNWYLSAGIDFDYSDEPKRM
jgi:UDP-glucuronate 4-epimerase